MTEPQRLGMVDDLTNEQYHAAPGYSSSIVRAFGEKSPLHFWYEHRREKSAEEIAEEEESEESHDLKFGSAFHAAVLEPDLFASTYVQSMPFNVRTNAGKAYRDGFAAECKAKGKIALLPDDFTRLRGMRDAVMRHPTASGLLVNGLAERSFFALDKRLGKIRKCRPDYLHHDGYAVVDLKSAADASPTKFIRAGADMGYDLAAPWYLDILADLYGEAPKNFIWVAVEKEPPYAIGVYYLDIDAMDRARTTINRWFEQLVECENTGIWHDWSSETILPFTVPPWNRRG